GRPIARSAYACHLTVLPVLPQIKPCPAQRRRRLIRQIAVAREPERTVLNDRLRGREDRRMRTVGIHDRPPLPDLLHTHDERKRLREKHLRRILLEVEDGKGSVSYCPYVVEEVIRLLLSVGVCSEVVGSK